MRAVWVIIALVLLVAGLATLPPLFQSGRASNERNPWSSLKTLATAQADFRANDRDGNREQDFWVRDVAGLYYLKPEGGDAAIQLIELSVANADDTACPESAAAGHAFAPKMGYVYRALIFYEDAAGKKQLYEDVHGRNPSKFGFIGVPVGPEAGQRDSYVINEENTIFRKKLQGARVDTFPRDPLKAGWSKLD